MLSALMEAHEYASIMASKHLSNHKHWLKENQTNFMCESMDFVNMALIITYNFKLVLT